MMRLMEGSENGWGMRAAVMARLFAQNPSGQESAKEELLKYILEAYNERHELAVQWLHQREFMCVYFVRCSSSSRSSSTSTSSNTSSSSC
jgi:hypothetical protein